MKKLARRSRRLNHLGVDARKRFFLLELLPVIVTIKAKIIIKKR